jgi:two-component system, OmpR family, sensor kinase
MKLLTSLRTRLSLIMVVVALAGLFFFGALAYGIFVRLQQAQLEALLARELERVMMLMDAPELDARLLSVDRNSAVLQLVTLEGRVVLPLNAEPLPLRSQPTWVGYGGRTFLVSSLSWRAQGRQFGTIRLGLDVSDALAARQALLQSMIGSGLVIALLGMTFGVYSIHRALAPLRAIAAGARGLDPSHPQLARYEGPKDEVADLAEALHTALENIRGRQASERAFLAEIAHELAAPLTLVSAHLDALAKTQGGDPQVRAAREAAHELLYTSQDLLTLARGELERPLELEVLDLAEVLRRIASEYPDVHLALLDQGTVAGDPQRLAQVVRNLVRNAVQASGDAKKVWLSLGRQEGEVRLSVCDEGPGISPEDLPFVFERFYSRQGGTGLGLSIARSLVERHGGTLSVRSDAGCCFTMTLPSLAASLEDYLTGPAESAV